jgi:hypothetical protein
MKVVRASLGILILLSVQAAAAGAQSVDNVDPDLQVVDCPVPALFGETDEAGIGIAIKADPGYAYPRLYIDDETTFDDSAASVCVPAGYILEIFAEVNYQGRSIELVGPRAVGDLGAIGWARTVSSARARYAPADESGSADETQANTPEDTRTDPPAWAIVERSYQKALAADTCQETRDSFRRLHLYVHSTEELPSRVQARYRGVDRTVGHFAQLASEEIRRRRFSCFESSHSQTSAWAGATYARTASSEIRSVLRGS